MKLKLLAAACALACTTTVFAAPPANLPGVNPANVVYISGASAQATPLRNILRTTTSVFQTPADVVTVTGPNGSQGFYGNAATAISATNAPLLVIYNSTNGSAAGLNQLLSNQGSVTLPATPTWEAEANVLTLAGCTSAVTGTSGAYVATCTTAANRETDMALSDVYATEFGSSGSLFATGDTGAQLDSLGNAIPYLTTGDIVFAGPVTTGLEGFGVIVNGALFDKLLAKNIADGVVPSTCSVAANGFATITTASTALCMPSINSAQYGLIAAGGLTVNSNILTGDLQTMKLARRDELSGTQAASNIFFLNNVCGAVGYGGAQTPARSTDGNANLIISEEPGTGNVITTVRNTASPAYALGVVSTSNTDKFTSAAITNYAYVKVDGVSPVHKGLGTVDATRRFNILNGTYKFATEMAAYVRSSITGVPAGVTAAIANKLGSSVGLPVSSTTVPGVAYLDQQANGPADGNNSAFKRDGNNCAPLH